MKILKQNQAKLTRYPLLGLLIAKTDTPDIINKAFEIANEHPFYVGDGGKARFATFLTEKESQGRPSTAPPAIRISTGGELLSVYEEHRFKSALWQARGELKESKNS